MRQAGKSPQRGVRQQALGAWQVAAGRYGRAGAAAGAKGVWRRAVPMLESAQYQQKDIETLQMASITATCAVQKAAGKWRHHVLQAFAWQARRREPGTPAEGE